MAFFPFAEGLSDFPDGNTPPCPLFSASPPLCLACPTGSDTNPSHCGPSGRLQGARGMSDLSDAPRSRPSTRIWLTKQPFFCSVFSSGLFAGKPMDRTNATRVSPMDTNWTIRARRVFQNCAVRKRGAPPPPTGQNDDLTQLAEDKYFILKPTYRRLAFLPFGNDFAQKKSSAACHKCASCIIYTQLGGML